MSVAIYPGTFDPLTNGHVDLVQRACRLFDRIVIGVAGNALKNPLIPFSDRIDLVKSVFNNTPAVVVEPVTGLLVDFVREHHASVIVRGIRGVVDVEHERQLAAANHALCSEIETLFLPATEKYTHISSSLVREVAHFSGDVTLFVPAQVADYLGQKR